MTSPRRRPRSPRRLAAWLVAAFVPAAIGAPFPAPEWYRALDKPAWSPPPWLFAPVWTLLYATIGIAAWLVDRSRPMSRVVLGLFALQLALNALWTPIFFGLRRPFAAFVEIVAMWAAILATVVAFARTRLAAGLLLLPYLVWVTFAALLNAAIWRRNR
jgi:tryptophan-rich sensory protein